MSFSSLFDPTFCVRLTLALLHFLWLGAAIGLLAWAGGLLLRRSSAHARYLLQVAALLLLAGCLPLTFFFLGDGVAARRATDAAHNVAHNADREASGGWSARRAAETDGSSDVNTGLRDGGPRRAAIGASPLARLDADASQRLDGFPSAAGPSFAASPSSLRRRLLERGAPYVAAAYLTGVALVLLRLLQGARAGHRLASRGSAVSDRGLLERARIQAERFRLRAAPPLRWCGEISIPVVIGVAKPIIMLPATAATGLSLDQLQLLLTHELAHIRRYDLAVNLLQRVIEAALFFHPAVWLISRRVGVERELACDELVLAEGCERARYADALVRMAELSAAERGRSPTAVAGLAATGAAPTEFKRRVLKVLGDEAPAPAPLSRLGVASMSALILLSVVIPITWRPTAAALARSPNAIQVKDSRTAPASETGKTPEKPDEKTPEKPDEKTPEKPDEKTPEKPDEKGAEKPGSNQHGGAMTALDTAPMHECRALIKRLDDAGQTRLASEARERLAKRWKRIAERPVASFLRDLPKPNPNAEAGIDRGDVIGVQTELDGVWSTGKGTADNWTDWIARKQDKYRVDRLHLLFDAAQGYRRADDAAAAARVLQAGLSGHEIYDSELPALIKKYWPVTDDTPAKSLGPGPEAWTLVNYLGELSSAQQALGEIDRAIVTQSRLTLACFMLSWKQPAAAPTQRARELWSLIRQRPESPPPLFWFHLVDEKRSRHAFDLSSAGPRGQPLTHHHYNMAAAPPLDFRELKVTARVKGREGLLDCYRINAAGKHETLAALRPAARGDEEQTLTRAFRVPAGTGLIQFMVAGKGFRVGEVQVEATFAVRALQKGPPDEDPKASDKGDPLTRPVTIEAENVPLGTVLETLASNAGLTAELDGEALAEVGLDLKQPITVSFRDLPLQRALGRVIDWRSHLGAMREVRGKKLVFTTLAARQQRTAERLPEWMKPLYSHGLLATLDDDNEVVGITSGGIVTNELLARFAELPRLRELKIEVTKWLTPEGLAHLGRMQRLEKLSLYNVNTEGAALGDDAIRSMVGLASLRELAVNECGTTDAGAKLLEKLPQLTSLSLRQEGRLTDAALESIGKLTRLESLSLDSYVGTARLGRMAFSAAGIRQLKGLTELRSLHLVGHAVPADALDFPKLTSLGLGHSSVDDDAAARIGQLRALSTLELTYCNVSDSGLQAVAGLPELRRLNISGSTITDAGIKHLRPHKRLEHITLRVGSLTDEALEHVAEIKTLTRLDLYGSGQSGVAPGRNFSGAGLRRLKELPELETLWLTNFIAPGGYAVLKELRQLRELTMTMCDISTSELEALEEALPETQISHLTGGGSWIPKRVRNRK